MANGNEKSRISNPEKVARSLPTRPVPEMDPPAHGRVHGKRDFARHQSRPVDRERLGEPRKIDGRPFAPEREPRRVLPASAFRTAGADDLRATPSAGARSRGPSFGPGRGNLRVDAGQVQAVGSKFRRRQRERKGGRVRLPRYGKFRHDGSEERQVEPCRGVQRSGGRSSSPSRSGTRFRASSRPGA
jgi:hypothetical protein